MKKPRKLMLSLLLLAIIFSLIPFSKCIQTDDNFKYNFPYIYMKSDTNFIHKKLATEIGFSDGSTISSTKNNLKYKNSINKRQTIDSNKLSRKVETDSNLKPDVNYYTSFFDNNTILISSNAAKNNLPVKRSYIYAKHFDNVEDKTRKRSAETSKDTKTTFSNLVEESTKNSFDKQSDTNTNLIYKIENVNPTALSVKYYFNYFENPNEVNYQSNGLYPFNSKDGRYIYIKCEIFIKEKNKF